MQQKSMPLQVFAKQCVIYNTSVKDTFAHINPQKTGALLTDME